MVTAFAPATVANLNCGFDVLGMAIAAPGDEVSVWFNDAGTVRIVEITGDEGRLSYQPEKNTATGGMLTLLQHVGCQRGVDVRIAKKMPFGSGLGSSAASAVAGVMALNRLLDSPLSKQQLVSFALDGEVIASGSRHADNVAPSMLGGIVLIRGYNPLDMIELPVPSNLFCVAIYPKIEILTKEARNILPKEIPLKTAITQTGNLAGLVSALYTRDFMLLERSMTDLFAEPYRAPLIPHFHELRQLALGRQALAFGISGSGPGMFALTQTADSAEVVSYTLQQFLQSRQIPCLAYVSEVNRSGAIIVS
ncbi:homoserine kinase [Sphingobacteriales bacterium UPWRP_1]|nr:homoserine kinase [Sphingobacteriales bacterium TSM_CSM]PSJ77808.1 homoserine kinase [Sphingobacteriales bacterium UPWRP_1]